MVIRVLKDVLKEAREHKNLKQSEVAEYVGVTPQTYMKWENGKNEPKASNVKKLAEILSVTEGEICQGKTFSDSNDPLEFMQKVASIKNYIDDVTFTSILFNCVQDKANFISKLEAAMKKTHGFSAEELNKIGGQTEDIARDIVEAKNDHNDLLGR